MKMNRRNNRLAALLLAMMVALCGVSALAESTEDAATIAVVGENAEAAAEETAEAAEATAEETGEAAEATEETEDEGPVHLATVNGEEIWINSDDVREIEDIWNYYLMYGYDVELDQVKAQWLNWKVRNALYRQNAEDLKVDTITEEQKASFEAEGKANWEQVIAQFMTEKGITDDSTEEEIEAAKAEVLANIEENFGYTEASYVEERIEEAVENQIIENVKNAVIGEITISEDEVSEYIDTEYIERDKNIYELNPAYYVEQYEFMKNYPQYYYMYGGKDLYYIPDYRGVSHILLKVEQSLLDNWTDLNARLEENSEETAPETESDEADTSTETEELPEEKKEPVTQEMVENARLAILENVKEKTDIIQEKILAGESFESLIAEYGEDPGMLGGEALTDYQNGNTDFAALYQKYGIGMLGDNAHNGYQIRKESTIYDQTFTATAAALENVGDTSEPIVTQFGVHILHYQCDIPAAPVEITEEAYEALKAEALQEKEEAAAHEMEEGWLEVSEIVYTEDGQQIINSLIPEEKTESVTATEATEEALKDGE